MDRLYMLCSLCLREHRFYGPFWWNVLVNVIVFRVCVCSVY